MTEVEHLESCCNAQSARFDLAMETPVHVVVLPRAIGLTARLAHMTIC